MLSKEMPAASTFALVKLSKFSYWLVVWKPLFVIPSDGAFVWFDLAPLLG